MARSDEAWVQDILAAIVDIRSDTTSMDFASFAANPAIVRSVLYSIAIMGEAAKTSAQRSDQPIQTSHGALLPESATGLSTSISALTSAASGTLSPTT